MTQPTESKWNQYVPWFLTIACTLVLIGIGLFLQSNIEWYKTGVMDDQLPEYNTAKFRFYAYHLHLSMIKRSIGLFSGFATMFLGLGVAFFTLKSNTNMEMQGSGVFTAKIATASPGLVALIVGAYLIVSTINSKDKFPSYDGSSNDIEHLEEIGNIKLQLDE